jgi:integrase
VQFGGAPADPLFRGVQGRSLATITYRRAWDRAREVALTDEEYQSPLARRPYDLRHACLSTWLNGGVAPTQVAEWAGHSRSMPAVALSIDNSRKASRNQMANPYVRTRIGTVCADRCSSAGRGAVSYTAGRTGTHLVNCYQVH